MSSNDCFPSLVEIQFRRAKSLCNRNAPVEQTQSVRQQEPSGHPDSVEPKSYAQVESLVRPHVVRQNSGGLKPGRKRPYRLMARFSEAERETVIAKAKDSHLSVNEFARVCLLGPAYMPSLDPLERKLLQDINRELSRQGNNLNQIAKHLNAGTATRGQGDSMIDIITRSLIATQKAVRQALAKGQTEE